MRKQDVLAIVNGGGAGVEDPPLHIESPYRPDPPVPAHDAAPSPTGAPAPALAATGDGLSRMRRQIGEHMKRSLEVAATCTTWAEADLTRVEKARRTLGVTALAYHRAGDRRRAARVPGAQRLARRRAVHPARRHQPRHRGLPRGGRADRPVIHRAQELSVEGLAARIRELAGRARTRQLTNDDVSGGTFTITAPGQFGSIMATPVINQPQVGILDFEAVVKRPVVVTDEDGNDSIAIRSMTILGPQLGSPRARRRALRAVSVRRAQASGERQRLTVR